MLIRVVKMTFREEAVPAFLMLFEERKEQIRGFAGCTHLELWRDRLHTNIFFTYSHWQHADQLEHYRTSPFFLDIWHQTRSLFSAKPEAWSINPVSILA